MNKKYFQLILLIIFVTLIVTFFSTTFFYPCCGPSPKTTSVSNIVIRNNEHTNLKEFNVVANITIKPGITEYVNYEKDFHGEFVLFNDGSSDEEIILAYPFKGTCLRDSYTREMELPESFKIFVDGLEISDYEVLCTPPKGGYVCGTWANGSSFCVENVKELECSEKEGPFASNRSRTIRVHVKDKSEESPDNPCTKENPCYATVAEDYYSYCFSINNTYSCECKDRGVNDEYPRHICKEVCYLRNCTEKSCSLCKEIDCIIPYGRVLVGSTVVMLKTIIPKKTEKTIEVQYHEEHGEEKVYYTFYDEFSWKGGISGTVTFNLVNGKLRDYSDYEKKWWFFYKESPIHKRKGIINSYSWQLRDIDTTIYETSKIYVPVIGYTIIDNIIILTESMIFWG